VAKAAACFTRSLDLDPTSPAVYANLAAAYLKAGAFQQAEASADSALLLDEGYVKAFHRRATARTALGKLAEAKADLERVLQSLPGNPQVLEELRNLRLRSDTVARPQKVAANKAMQSPMAKTLADFEKTSRTLHDNPAALAAYVRSLQSDFAGLFKDSLEAAHIAAFAVALSDDSYCVQQPMETLDALQALSQVKRFGMVSMLMSTEVRATFSSIFDRLSGHSNDEVVTRLRKAFGCKVM
jgi:tetratricopeptide (TPR) repeat protein